MIEKFLLLEGSALVQAGITDHGYSDLARDPFTRPLLPFLNEDSQWISV